MWVIALPAAQVYAEGASLRTLRGSQDGEVAQVGLSFAEHVALDVEPRLL
jgi:hypothetical protein